MTLDPQITRKIQQYLDTPPAERDIAAGALLMLQLNRNRALYNSIIRKPEKFAAKLEYELKKYLRIRLDNLTVADVASAEREIMPRACATIGASPEESPSIPVEAELPGARKARGRRPDHDSLPPEVRELWDSNGPRLKKIVIVYNELKAMSDLQPCDRYEKLKILDELDKQYRRNMELYDSYAPAQPGTPRPVSPLPSSATDRAVSAARKTISKYKRVYADNIGDPAKTAVAKEKIRAAVDVIRNAGARFSEETVRDLTAIGISFD